jgi:hypothetical protein
MQRILAILALLLAVVYAGDFLSLRLRIPRREPLGSVTVRRYYAVTLKNHKTEYMFDEPESQTCVNSLFPHDGHDPCWYLSRHSRQQININSGRPSMF